MLRLLVFCCGAFLFFVSSREGHGADISVAVLDFTCNNSSRAEAEMARNRVEVLVFNESGARILERSVFRKKLLEYMDPSECRDDKCAARIGRIVQADYVIIGSLDRLSDYSLNVRMVNVADGSLVFSTARSFKDKNDLLRITESVSMKMALKLRRIKKGERIFFPYWLKHPGFSAGPYWIKPMLALSDRSTYAFAFMARCEFLIMHGLFSGIESGCIGFMDKSNNYYATILPTQALAGYEYKWKTVLIAPYISYGACYSRIADLQNGILEQIAGGGLRLYWDLVKWQAFVSLGYYAVIERTGPVQMLACGLGMKYLL